MPENSTNRETTAHNDRLPRGCNGVIWVWSITWFMECMARQQRGCLQQSMHRRLLPNVFRKMIIHHLRLSNRIKYCKDGVAGSTINVFAAIYCICGRINYFFNYLDVTIEKRASFLFTVACEIMKKKYVEYLREVGWVHSHALTFKKSSFTPALECNL